MMVKIGNSYFAEAAIEAIVPKFRMVRRSAEAVKHNAYDVHLANGNIVTAEASEGEVAAVVDLLGLLVPDEPERGLGLDELEELASLFAAGYRWAARDRDGKIFAYKDKPEKGDNSWLGTEFERLYQDFEAITFEADSPLDLTKLFAGVPG